MHVVMTQIYQTVDFHIDGVNKWAHMHVAAWCLLYAVSWHGYWLVVVVTACALCLLCGYRSWSLSWKRTRWNVGRLVADRHNKLINMLCSNSNPFCISQLMKYMTADWVIIGRISKLLIWAYLKYASLFGRQLYLSVAVTGDKYGIFVRLQGAITINYCMWKISRAEPQNLANWPAEFGKICRGNCSP